jgi:hypothetical protein
MYNIFYLSRATLRELEVHSILQAARTRNAQLGVTGMLVFSGEYFAQLLEGERLAIRALMAAIRKDPRHSILCEWPTTRITARWFPEWSMGYSYNAELDGLVEHLLRDTPHLPSVAAFATSLFSAGKRHSRAHAAAL